MATGPETMPSNTAARQLKSVREIGLRTPARMPVALAANLNQTIKEYKRRGVFVVGLDGDGDVSLPNFQLFDKPLLVVVGSEGKGLSRLVQENCDQVISIPISQATESLNAGIAASVALYQISTLRS